MSDRELYSRLLLVKGHGYPLSHPQPSDDLPPESRTKGIEIGDVGILTSDGGFDALFNICRASDDPANRHGVPVGFETVDLGPTDVLSRGQYHRPGSHVSNENISKRRLDVDTDLDNVFSPVGAGAVIEISTVSKQAAILLMPEGGSRINLRFLDKFRQQALKHAQNWYAFLKSLGSMVEHDELYLVTGVDKSSSWIVGAVDNQSRDCNISLKLKAAQIGSTSGSYAWQWETSVTFADSGPRRPGGEDPSVQNQTVFLRGFRIAIHIVGRKKIAQAIPVMDSKPLPIFSRRWFASFSQSPSLGSTAAVSRDTSGGQAGPPHDKWETIEYCPETPRPYHPADAINKHLLDSVTSPEGPLVAVTHDDEWVSVLRDDDEMVPAKAELIGRIFDRYIVDFTHGGAYLRNNADECPSTLSYLEAPPHFAIRLYMVILLASLIVLLFWSLAHVPHSVAPTIFTTWRFICVGLAALLFAFYTVRGQGSEWDRLFAEWSHGGSRWRKVASFSRTRLSASKTQPQISETPHPEALVPFTISANMVIPLSPFVVVMFWSLAYASSGVSPTVSTTWHYIRLGLASVATATFWRVTICLGFTSVFTIYAALLALYLGPAYKLDQVEDEIKVTEKILEDAIEIGAQNVQWRENAARLSFIKLAAFQIRTRMLRTTSCRQYLRDVKKILRSINQYAKQVKEVHTSTLLNIEAERLRRLSEENAISSSTDFRLRQAVFRYRDNRSHGDYSGTV